MKSNLFIILCISLCFVGCSKTNKTQSTVLKDNSNLIESTVQDNRDNIIEQNAFTNDNVYSFLTEMYNNHSYEDYDWLEQHCTKKCLQYLQKEYDYDCEDGRCYAVWKFRTNNQDGYTEEHKMLSVENQGDGYFDYTFIDMGFKGVNRVKVISVDNTLLIDEISQVSEETF